MILASIDCERVDRTTAALPFSFGPPADACQVRTRPIAVKAYVALDAGVAGGALGETPDEDLATALRRLRSPRTNPVTTSE